MSFFFWIRKEIHEEKATIKKQASKLVKEEYKNNKMQNQNKKDHTTSTWTKKKRIQLVQI